MLPSFLPKCLRQFTGISSEHDYPRARGLMVGSHSLSAVGTMFLNDRALTVNQKKKWRCRCEESYSRNSIWRRDPKSLLWPPKTLWRRKYLKPFPLTSSPSLSSRIDSSPSPPEITRSSAAPSAWRYEACRGWLSNGCVIKACYGNIDYVISLRVLTFDRIRNTNGTYWCSTSVSSARRTPRPSPLNPWWVDGLLNVRESWLLCFFHALWSITHFGR